MTTEIPETLKNSMYLAVLQRKAEAAERLAVVLTDLLDEQPENEKNRPLCKEAIAALQAYSEMKETP